MPQKIVQARVWAQGLTIGIIIAAGIITSSQRAKNRSDEDDPRFRHLVSGSLLRTILYLLNTEETSSSACGPFVERYPRARAKGAGKDKRLAWSRPYYLDASLGTSHYGLRCVGVTDLVDRRCIIL